MSATLLKSLDAHLADNQIFRYPVLFVGLVLIYGALQLAFIPPSPRVISLRLVGFILHFCLVCIIFLYADTGSYHYQSFIPYYHVGFLAGLGNVSFLKQFTPHQTANTPWDKFKWALSILLDVRCINASPQPRNLPQFPIRRFHSPSSKHVFVISRLLMAWLYHLLAKILDTLHAYYQQNLQDGDYAPHKEYFFRRIHEVSLREMGIRIVLPVFFVILQVLDMSTFFYLVDAVVVFAAGERAIPSYKYPMFGDIREAYTVRNYWRKFWGSYMRSTYVAWGSLITTKLLRVPKHNRYYKHAMLIIIFQFSGLSHEFVHLGAKLRIPGCGFGHVYWWYTLNSFGIIIEGVLLEFGMLIMKRYGWNTDANWCYWLGYLWVWGFFAWSLPKHAFPSVDCRWD